MKQFYVYLTTNQINGKKYIGQHYGELNDSYLGSGTILKKAIIKFGRENFTKEILEICDNYESLNKAEEKWIAQYNAISNPNFYNIASGGLNSNPIAGMTEEAKQERAKKLSIAATGKRNHFYGQHFKGEQHPMYGKHHTKEAKEKMRAAKQGGKTPTARSVAIYDLNNNLVQKFDTQRELKIFLGLSPNGSTETLHKFIESNQPYHGYIIKFI